MEFEDKNPSILNHYAFAGSGMDNHDYRKHIRLKNYDYSNSGWYFVTICTNFHKTVFGKIIDGEMILNKNGKIVEEEWLKTEIVRSNVKLDSFIIMPNHLHGILILWKTL